MQPLPDRPSRRHFWVCEAWDHDKNRRCRRQAIGRTSKGMFVCGTHKPEEYTLSVGLDGGIVGVDLVPTTKVLS